MTLLKTYARRSSTLTARFHAVNHLELEALKERIVACIDEVDFLDIIGFTIADLVEVLKDEVENHATRLDAACR